MFYCKILKHNLNCMILTFYIQQEYLKTGNIEIIKIVTKCKES